MLYNFEKKLGVLYIPKTASCTLHQVVTSRVEFDYKEHNHTPLPQFMNVMQLEGTPILPGSRFFCVYREPVDWFISACNYFKHADHNFKVNLLQHLNLIGELSYFDKHRSFNEYKDIIASITIKDCVKVLKKIRDSNSEIKVHTHLQLWRPQSDYLDNPDVVPLDYRDMLGSINTILTAFDVDNVEEIPHVNVTESKTHTRDNITQEDIDAIKDYYQADYAFFEKAGISFDV